MIRFCKIARDPYVDECAIVRYLEHTFMSFFIVGLGEVGSPCSIFLYQPLYLLDKRRVILADLYFAEIIVLALDCRDRYAFLAIVRAVKQRFESELRRLGVRYHSAHKHAERKE